MDDIAFLVEGQLEQKFIQNSCKNSIVRLIGCNGITVSMEAIAKRVASHYRLIEKRANKIVVIFDREGRQETCTELEKALLAELEKQIAIEKIIVGLPDRNIESWMLYDAVAVESVLSVKPAKKATEGSNGKSEIKKIFKNYHETTIGVNLLKACSASKLQKSKSFRNLAEKMKDLDCWWLKR